MLVIHLGREHFKKNIIPERHNSIGSELHCLENCMPSIILYKMECVRECMTYYVLGFVLKVCTKGYESIVRLLPYNGLYF